jgi:hypothetical protein
MDKKNDSESSEPYFYVALVLKGTEKQYLNLLEFIGGCYSGEVVYQCKSSKYLRVVREDDVKCGILSPELVAVTK